MNNSCFIVLSTPNYEKIYKHFFFSLVGIGIDSKHIYHNLDNKLDNGTYKKEGFQTDLWYYCVSQKIKHFKTISKAFLQHQTYEEYKLCLLKKLFYITYTIEHEHRSI